jgi:hypothetical protein
LSFNERRIPMDSTPTLEDIVRFYDEVGAPSSFGCDEGEVKNWISYCEKSIRKRVFVL